MINNENAVEIVRPTFDGEIKVKIPENMPEIKHNLGPLKEFALKAKDFYSKLVFNDDNIAEAKEEKTKINKLIEEVKRQRIDNVKEYKKPIEDFEKTAKEIESLLGEAKDSVQVFIDKAEDERKQEKYEKVIKPIINLAINNAFVNGYYIETESITIDNRWYNKTYKEKDIEEDVDTQVKELERKQDEYNQGIEVIKSNLEAYGMSDKLDKYTERFKYTLDLTDILKNIQEEHNSLSSQQKQVIDNSSMFDYVEPTISYAESKTSYTEVTLHYRGTVENIVKLKDYAKSLGMEEIK